MKKDIVMYLKPYCPFCIRLKVFLDHKKVDYIEIDLTRFPEKKNEMEQLSNGKTTVPQLFIDGKYIGDSAAVFGMESRGDFDSLLS